MGPFSSDLSETEALSTPLTKERTGDSETERHFPKVTQVGQSGLFEDLQLGSGDDKACVIFSLGLVYRAQTPKTEHLDPLFPSVLVEVLRNSQLHRTAIPSPSTPCLAPPAGKDNILQRRKRRLRSDSPTALRGTTSAPPVLGTLARAGAHCFAFLRLPRPQGAHLRRRPDPLLTAT